MPCHHNLQAYLHAYIDGTGICEDPKAPLFRTISVWPRSGRPYFMRVRTPGRERHDHAPALPLLAPLPSTARGSTSSRASFPSSRDPSCATSV
jgi:hypothetical protein